MNADMLEFQKIFDTYQPKILRYLTRLTGESDAEDLAQETFVKVHKALETFRGESQLSTWIYRIATNTALDRIRNPSFQRSERLAIFDEIIEDNGEITRMKEEHLTVEKQLIKKEMNDCVREYINKLPEDYRIALVLSEYEGLKNSEIAEVLAISLDTVKIRLHRAKGKLKNELEEHCEAFWIEEMPCSMK